MWLLGKVFALDKKNFVTFPIRKTYSWACGRLLHNPTVSKLWISRWKWVSVLPEFQEEYCFKRTIKIIIIINDDNCSNQCWIKIYIWNKYVLQRLLPKKWLQIIAFLWVELWKVTFLLDLRSVQYMKYT